MAATALAACATPEPAPRDARPATTAPTALWFGGDVHLGDAGGGGLGDIRDSVTGAVGVVNLEGPVAAVVTAADCAAEVVAPAPVRREVVMDAGGAGEEAWLLTFSRGDRQGRLVRGVLA